MLRAPNCYRALLRHASRELRDALYFRRGLILSDENDLQGARKEFVAAADEASRFPLAETRQEYLVRSRNGAGKI